MVLWVFSISLVFMGHWLLIFLMLVFFSVFSFLNLYKNFSYDVFNSWIYLDSMSSFLVLLSVFIVLFSFVGTYWNKSVIYTKSLLLLVFFLFLAFSVKNLLCFYFFFEASLIPTLFLIIAWGYQPERLQAGTYMIMYTVLSSMPFLFFILYCFYSLNTLEVVLLMYSKMEISSIVFYIIVLAFLVKLPMYGLHLWLPKAHVEAPLSGSMILAGVLLKLGGYGLYLLNYILSLKNLNTNLVVLSFLSLWGGLLATLMCFRQSDMKAMVAYSSVAHMSLVIVGMFLNSNWGLLSAKITMLAHGFTSSALFMLVNMSYKKIYSRSFNTSGGLLTYFPKMSLLWFIFCSINMAAPPSMNLLGEMMVIPSLKLWGAIFVILMCIIMLLSAGYNMMLYVNNNHGGPSFYVTPSMNYNSSEYYGLLMHVLPFFLLFKMELF
uniref:NADH-ubiquinone oxidoreductase chain 4 n=1 Tax=Pupilla muscorum TaxID=225749 RepID=A0A0A6ZAH4_9EUPU|nr:NADH dehydrogenase subunit 4 [Pupilla muscorum]AGC52873.1 NADH dehydrogenase subunit 4 [Pupilla muscorum]